MEYEHLRMVRGCQQAIYLPEREIDGDELIRRQELLEMTINFIMKEEVDRLLDTKDIVYKTQIKFLVGMSNSQRSELRGMQGDAFKRMAEVNWEGFQQQMLTIEGWIDQIISQQVANAMAPLVSVREHGGGGYSKN